MSRRISWCISGVLVIGAAASLLAASIRGPATGTSLQARTLAIAATLRCPVCQDLSVADSPSPLAGQMRATIARDLQAGMSPDEVRATFVRAYGDWILLSPPLRGPWWFVRWAPWLALVLGGAAIGFVLQRWRQRPARGEGTSSEPTPGELTVLAGALALHIDDEDE